MVADIPPLIGLDYKEIQLKLGKPTEDTPPTTAAKKEGVWDNAWWYSTGTLGVKYKLSNNEIIEYFLFTPESAFGTKDKQSLLAAGNLTEDDPRYIVRFIAAKNAPDEYTGVVIQPKKRAPH